MFLFISDNQISLLNNQLSFEICHYFLTFLASKSAEILSVDKSSLLSFIKLVEKGKFTHPLKMRKRTEVESSLS